MRILLRVATWVVVLNATSPFSTDAPGIDGQSLTTTLRRMSPPSRFTESKANQLLSQKSRWAKEFTQKVLSQ